LGLTASVVIPCRNGEPFLADAIHSARTQSRAADEIIVVDDGSTDGTRRIAREAGVRVIVLESATGVSHARNRGIEAASGDVVAFLDADDLWEMDHLERTIGTLERHPEAHVAFGLCRIAGASPAGLRFSHEVLAIVDALGEKPVEMDEWLFVDNLLPQSATVVRRQALLAVDGYDESLRYAEDYDLWLRLAVHHRFVCCHAVTCTYRVHPNQVSAGRGALPRFVEAEWRARNRHLESIERLGDERRFARLVERAQTRWTRDMGEMAWMAEWEAVDRLIAALHHLQDSPWRNSALRRWRRRRPLGPVWSLVRAIWQALPTRAQERVRRLRRRQLNPNEG
jgi:glycosyltransferase involved in cell wall biosynthesis